MDIKRKNRHGNRPGPLATSQTKAPRQPLATLQVGFRKYKQQFTLYGKIVLHLFGAMNFLRELIQI